jgi:endo-1,4-beta-xylanase
MALRTLVGSSLVIGLIATTSASQPLQVCKNRTGTHDGYFYTFWKTGGEACLTLGRGGRHTVNYRLQSRENLVVGKGWRVGSVSHVVSYRALRFDAGTNSYLTLYGWSNDPLTEYYAIDSWGSSFKPSRAV